MALMDKLYWGIWGKLLPLFAESKVDINEITTGAGDGGTFSNVVTSTKQLGQDLYSTLMIIGGFGGVIMLIIAFLYFALAGNGNNKEQAKGKILTVLLAVAGIFAAVFIVGLAQSIGEALAGQQGN